MAYDLEEQEKIDALSDWWKQYGNYVIGGVIAFVAAVLGFQGWQRYQAGQAEEGAELFARVEVALAGNDAKKIGEAAATLMDKLPNSPYAARAALAAGRASFDAGDLNGAKLRLQWVVDRAPEPALKDIARLRLAGVLLDEKKHDEALKLLDAPHGEAFDGLYADVRGDVLAGQGKVPEAKAAYKVALEKLDPRGAYRTTVQAKLGALGEAQ